MNNVNPALAAAWNAENQINFYNAIAHRAMDENSLTTIPPRTRHRALGFACGWDACRLAIQQAIGEIVTEYVRAAQGEQMITAAQLGAMVERIAAQHAAVVRPVVAEQATETEAA